MVMGTYPAFMPLGGVTAPSVFRLREIGGVSSASCGGGGPF